MQAYFVYLKPFLRILPCGIYTRIIVIALIADRTKSDPSLVVKTFLNTTALKRSISWSLVLHNIFKKELQSPTKLTYLQGKLEIDLS